MKFFWWYALLLILLLGACKQEPVNLGTIKKFFPSDSNLRQGIVSKFYAHYTPKNKDRSPYTNISYYGFKYDAPHWLTVQKFNAGMELVWFAKHKVEEEKWFLEEQDFHYKDEVYKAAITENNIVYNWVNPNAKSIKTLSTRKGYNSTFSSQQVAVKDTLVESMNCKNIVRNVLQTTISPKNDTTDYNYTVSTIFAPNFGMYAQEIVYDKVITNYELVEQMSMSDFKERAKHGKKRMAYIDPKNTLDDNSNFELCNHELKIGDYYNCDNRGELRGGKGTWWRVLDKKLDSKKLKNESGYLTYRFVINCKGQAGRFMIEETSLKFEKKEFAPETVQHLYDIVSSQTDWQVCEGGRNIDTQDAYTYITFKLKDGKIIDLLP